MEVQEMRNARIAPAVIYSEYLKKVRNYEKVCFVEGDDDRLYYNELIGCNSLYICCNGKENLIKLLQLIVENHKSINKKTRIMFFMDGDYDNKIFYKDIYKENKKYLYILDEYSIENLYLTTNSIGDILKREFGMNVEDEDYIKEIQRYKNLILDTVEQFKNINYAFYIVRQIRRNAEVCFTGVSKSKVFSYIQKDNTICKKNLRLSDMANILKVEDFSDDEKQLALEFFNSKDLMRYGRGHNNIWIMEMFLHDLYLRNKRKKLSKVYSCSFEFSNCIISHCAYAAEKPKSLLSFIG